MAKQEIYNLIKSEIPRLRRYGLFLAKDKDHADELVQECLVRAVANIDKWRIGTNMRSWLMTILHNVFVNEVKKLRPMLTPDGEIEFPHGTPGDQEDRHRLRDVQRAYNTLSATHKQVLWLVGVEELEYGEVAEVLHIPIGTVRSRVCRAREALRKAMEQSGKATLPLTDDTPLRTEVWPVNGRGKEVADYKNLKPARSAAPYGEPARTPEGGSPDPAVGLGGTFIE